MLKGIPGPTNYFCAPSDLNLGLYADLLYSQSL